MKPWRLARASTPVDVSVLAVIALVFGVGCLASAAFPLADDAPRALVAAFGLLGVSGAVVLVIAGARVTVVWLHSAVVILTLLRGVIVAVAITERGLMLSALGFVWTAVYVAFFFPPATARIYAALLTATLGASLLLARAPTDVSVWITISAMVWVAILVLTDLNTRLRAEAHCDGLTGLLNRTGFAFAAARLRAASVRRGEPIAIALIDLDDFKAVNDRDGHAAGDRLLVDLAAAWTASLRRGDLLARFGGDEFVLMTAGPAEDQVDEVLTRLGRAHPASWTVGAVLCTHAESIDEAIGRADARLYVAKGSARGSAADGHEVLTARG